MDLLMKMKTQKCHKSFLRHRKFIYRVLYRVMSFLGQGEGFLLKIPAIQSINSAKYLAVPKTSYKKVITNKLININRSQNRYKKGELNNE